MNVIATCVDKGPDLTEWLGMGINALAIIVTSAIAIISLLDAQSARKRARIEAHHTAWISIRQTLNLLRIAIRTVQMQPATQQINSGWISRVITPAVASANTAIGRPIGDPSLFNLASNVQILATAIETDLADRIAAKERVTHTQYLERIAPFIESLDRLEAEHSDIFTTLGIAAPPKTITPE